MRSILASLAVLFLAAPVSAAKLSDAFRAEFERTFAPHRTYAVVVEKGIPTTSVYGVQGNETRAHYSIDVKGDRWETSAGLLDTAQVAVDFLEVGEVLELDSISYKDNRLDLRMVSVEAHNVTRGGLLKATKREPVATNFKFFFPFPVSGPKDVPKAVAYVSRLVKPFPTERAARAFARSGGSAGVGAQAATPRASKKEIRSGMTALQVIEAVGKPQKELTFESKTRWTYPDFQVIFENGRVVEVKF